MKRLTSDILTEAAKNNPIRLKGMIFCLLLSGQDEERIQRLAYMYFGISADVYRNTLWDLGLLPCYYTY